MTIVTVFKGVSVKRRVLVSHRQAILRIFLHWEGMASKAMGRIDEAA